MAKVTGFLEHDRQENSSIAPESRIKNFREFIIPFSDNVLNDQASRCMDCGIPYCHNSCPVNNVIPEWNSLVYEKDWKNALETLHATNNFPEFHRRTIANLHARLNLIDRRMFWTSYLEYRIHWKC